jgi:hypothetical protein
VSSDEIHSQLIAKAAALTLGPLGIRRKGRSRTWLDDRAWWLGIIEFQPSSWSKGSYLNVGVMWLWDEVPYHVYDVGYRVSAFERYEDPAQFDAAAQALAKTAADEASRYRRMFEKPAGAADYYARLAGEEALGSHKAAGIALGLAGRSDASRERFDAYLAIGDDRDWALENKDLENKDRVRRLRALLGDHEAFVARLRESIANTRELLKLPPLSDWPF